MFICRILQSDWLDCRMSIIYTFPYGRSGLFILLFITVKTWFFFLKMGNKLLAENHEMLVMFRNLLVKVQKNWKHILLHFRQSFSSIFQNFPNLPQECSKHFSQAINSLITGWTVYTKNIHASVLRIDLPMVSLYARTLGFIFFHKDSPKSYKGDR